MKTLLSILFGFFTLSGLAQQWTVISSGMFVPQQPDPLFSFFNGINQRLSFKINPYDSSIWMVNDRFILTFDSDGDFQYFDESDHPNFDNFATFTTLAFTQNEIFASNEFYGLYRFNGDTWSQVAPVNDGIFLYSDLDTIWMGRMSGNDLIVTNSGTGFGFVGNRKLASKNGEFWGISGGYFRRYTTSNSYELLDADTIPYLLDNKNYDFKFSPNDNRFYTTGDKGISIALYQQFTDTITPFNTIGMPQLPVMEIEFDSQDNIWVTFGEWSIVAGTHPTVSFGYLNRTTMSWTIYDASNSAVTSKSAIEVDPCDNLWLSTSDALYVLNSGNCPVTWLGSEKITLEKNLLYPNPSSGDFSIVSERNINSFEVLDLAGRMIQQDTYYGKISINESGTYFVRLFENKELIGIEKIVVR